MHTTLYLQTHIAYTVRLKSLWGPFKCTFFTHNLFSLGLIFNSQTIRILSLQIQYRLFHSSSKSTILLYRLNTPPRPSLLCDVRFCLFGMFFHQIFGRHTLKLFHRERFLNIVIKTRAQRFQDDHLITVCAHGD